MIPGSYCQIVVWLIVTVFAQSFIYADSLFRIADDVIKQTVFDLPKSSKDRQPSRYNLWMYQNFMIMEGMDSLGEVTGNKKYQRYTDRSIDFLLPINPSLEIR